MGAKKKSSLRQFDLKKLWLFLIPIAFSILPGIWLMGTGDALCVFRFDCLLLIIGLAAFPLASAMFPLSRNAGLTLAKPLGLLICSLTVWTLTYLKIARFNIYFIFLSIIALAAVSWIPKRNRNDLIDRLKEDGTIENIVFEETMFVLVFTILCFYKGFLPMINGEEKMMDYGFIMSMIRNSTLPANDMWMSGYSINYYYFGQFFYAFLVKMSAINTGIGYNLCMCCSIALPFSMCYTIGQMLIDGARKNGMNCKGGVPVIGGVLTSLAVMIFGNSHSFYYDENSIGNGLTGLFKAMGADVGTTDHFFYPNSTRFIGHNPDTEFIEGFANGGDKTIEEFPFYSYLIGDLHAHVCSTIVVLLIIAVAITLVYRIAASGDMADIMSSGKPSFKQSFRNELSLILRPEIIAIAVLLGICQMTNYWDFLIYFIFGSMLLLVVKTTTSKDFSTIPGAVIFAVSVGGILGLYLALAYMPVLHTVLQVLLLGCILTGCAYFPCALTRTSAGMSFFFTVASLVALPFNANFDMISNKIAPCVNHSPLYQLFILWGTHVIICVTFVVFTIIYKNLPENRGRNSKTHGKTFPNKVAQFFGERNPFDVLMCGTIVVGILLLIAPEIFYVRDIYTGGYLRANTMFKFTYAGFIILSIGMIYSTIRLMFMRNKKGEFSTPAFVFSLVFCLFLFIPAHYTVVALKQRSGELVRANYKTLNGVAYLQDYQSPNLPNLHEGNLIDYDACIKWFNMNVEGDPVILEAWGQSYSDYNLVSAYTGLPTVCGWQTHEWLWRFHGIVDEETDLLISDPDNDVWALYLTPRHYDIDTIYTSSDPEHVRSLLDKYNVTYVIIGDLERAKYSNVDNTGLIASLGEIVFTSGSLVVVKVA